MSAMRSILLAATAALALSACNQTAPDDASAGGIPSAPATMATTNAKIEPVPGSTAPASPAAAPTATGTAMADNPAPSPTGADPSECGAGKAAKFVGKVATPDVRAQVIEAVGHNRIRWIGPTDSVTMDYSEGRLNADLSAANRITGFRCG
jgi:Peptidase inhibitor I78 family